ncbi:hypothetical protein EHE19_010225 [Ruminiclostridium herbifermentans]|uniref:Uncharacterized protein n=1 Tax=Ruminiclostridium herbifermentans TaxID=2488810 RepID=A0A7H1VIV5_9FIRM|nr:hypothetical protein [Ruminiclostridium herbifermentans]QNU65317.1 hypothetical protein EHE19_010225 [Ruminiclostridium herbifermentans]
MKELGWKKERYYVPPRCIGFILCKKSNVEVSMKELGWKKERYYVPPRCIGFILC